MSSTDRHPGRYRQRGQSIIWFLATMAACCCILALVYNVAQVSNGKEATTNGADAAALSGALVEARMLNFHAYANRAVVANQVTVAQLTSADSFLQYTQTLVQDVATYIEPIPIIGQTVGSAIQTAATGLQYAEDVYQQVAPAAIQGLEIADTELKAAADVAFNSAVPAASQVSNNIAQANATTLVNLGAILLANQSKWQGLRGGEDADAVATLVQESRDPFSTQRDNSDAIEALNTLAKVSGAFTVYPQLVKSSATTVLKDNNHWEAQDSLDLDTVTCVAPGVLCSDNWATLPLGYGRTDANNDNSQQDQLCRNFYFSFAQFKLLPTPNCILAMMSGDNLSWSGIPGLRDLASRKSTGAPCSKNNVSDSIAVPYVMAVQKQGSSTLTTQRIGFNNVDVPGPQGSPRMIDNLQNGDNLTSISEACVFFLRPDGTEQQARASTVGDLPRHDDVHELASLYNPYWQARLAAPDPGWIAAVYVLIGKPGLDQATQ
jgi:hypothetical protein